MGWYKRFPWALLLHVRLPFSAGGERVRARVHRYCARSLVLGQPEVAAAGLKVALGLSDDLVLSTLLSKGIDEIVNEFHACGSQEDLDNLKYCLEGTAGKPDDLPPHVKRSLETGYYHGGRIQEDDFDYGHHGMTLDDFVKHKHAKVCALSGLLSRTTPSFA